MIAETRENWKGREKIRRLDYEWIDRLKIERLKDQKIKGIRNREKRTVIEL